MQPDRCPNCGAFYFGTHCHNCGTTRGRIDIEKEPSESDVLKEIFDDIDIQEEFYGDTDS